MCSMFPLCTGHTRVGATLCSVEEEALEKEKDFFLQILSPPALRGRARVGLSVRDFCLINSTEHLPQKSSTVVKAPVTVTMGKSLGQFAFSFFDGKPWLLSNSALSVEGRLPTQILQWKEDI